MAEKIPIGPGPRLSEIPSEPGTPFASVQRFERRKLFLGKCILGICQDHDVKGTTFVLPGTQRHAEFEVALRGCSRDAKDDYSRVHTATRSDCSFLCIFIRQLARLVKQGNSPQKVVSPTLLTSRFSCCILDCGFRFGHISSIFLSMTKRTRRGTDFVGWESSTMQLKKPFRNVENSATCSPDSTCCLDTSPRVVIWFSGRCPVS